MLYNAGASDNMSVCDALKNHMFKIKFQCLKKIFAATIVIIFLYLSSEILNTVKYGEQFDLKVNQCIWNSWDILRCWFACCQIGRHDSIKG